jgi:asparagine synthase (glutamine-hydrolysing)
MLRCRLSFQQGGSPWSVTDGRWSNGYGFVEPFRHRALETACLRCGEQIAFIIREAPRDTPSAMTLPPIEDVDASTFASAIEDVAAWPLNIVCLLIDNTARTATLRSGMWGSAPLYALTRDGELRAEWDVARLYPYLRATVDFGRMAYCLVRLGLPYSRQTLFPEISLLTERSIARWEAERGTLAVEYPTRVSRAGAKELREGADVVGMFGEILSSSMARWIDEGSHVGAELSGGIDSSIVAIVATSLTQQPVRTYGLIMPGENGVIQAARRDEIINRFHLADTALSAAAYPPLMPGSTRNTDGMIVPWGEYYYEAVAAIIDRARADAIDMVLTGIGGDELATLTYRDLEYLGQSTEAPEGPSVPPFLTKRARDAYHEIIYHLDPAPQPAVEYSCLESTATNAILFLRMGIWPINPYLTPELVWFVRSLPPEWRDDRRLQRQYLRRRGCSDAVAYPTVTETFADVMSLAVRDRSREVLRALFCESRLAAAGLVDQDCLIESYDRYCSEEDDRLKDAFVEAAVQELTLRALEMAHSSCHTAVPE